MAKTVDITKHVLVPKHRKVSDAEKKQLMEKYSPSLKELPRILLADPAIASLEVAEGDIIRIERQSPTAGVSIFYRRVVHG